MSGDLKRSKKILTIPNLLSLFRLCLIPGIVWLSCAQENALLAVLLLALSGLTDVADGYIARKFHMVSELGKALDPIADKLTQLSVLICLTTRFPRMLGLAVHLAVKEVISAALNLNILRKTGSVPGAVWHGKFATVLFYATLLLHLLWPGIPSAISDYLIAAVAGVLLLSGVLYLIRDYHLLSGRPEKRRAFPKNPARLTGIVLCALFAVYTVVLLCRQGEYHRLPLALLTLFLVWLPELIQRILRCRLQSPLYFFALIYTICPMLGQCYNFYYILPGWDKLLHITGGVIFAMVGIYLYQFLSRQEHSYSLTAALFALFFSMALSMVWEFYEFGSDQLLGTDMQRDTVITAISSYDLGEAVGVTGRIEGIQQVTIDGEPLPVAGYLDIGLIDTMADMMLESLGALAVVLLYWIDRGRHPLIRPANG